MSVSPKSERMKADEPAVALSSYGAVLNVVISILSNNIGKGEKVWILEKELTLFENAYAHSFFLGSQH